MRIKQYIILLIIFPIIFTLATIGLELMEGNKITTTAYYGLRNIGVLFIFFIYPFSVILYCIIFLPLTLIMNKFYESNGILKIIIFSFVGCLCGIWAFNKLYGYAEGSLIRGYNLNISSAIILYSLAGLIYSIFDIKRFRF